MLATTTPDFCRGIGNRAAAATAAAAIGRRAAREVCSGFHRNERGSLIYFNEALKKLIYLYFSAAHVHKKGYTVPLNLVNVLFPSWLQTGRNILLQNGILIQIENKSSNLAYPIKYLDDAH